MSSTLKKGAKGKPKESASSMGSGSNLNSKTNIKASGATRASRVGNASRKSGLNNSSQARGAGAPIVRDPETGADVTPVSLLDSSKPAVLQGSHADYHDDLSPRSVNASDRFDALSSAGLSKSGWSSDGNATPVRHEKDEGGSLEEAGGEGDKEPAERVKITFENDMPPKAADLERDVAIILSETDTVFILDIHSACVADDDPRLETIKEENRKYTELVKAKAGQDKYADRAMQTRIVTHKQKDAQATPAPTISLGINCTNFEIHDAIAAADTGNDEKEEDLMGSKSTGKNAGTQMLSNIESQTAPVSGIEAATQAIFNTDAFKKSLVAMERSVVQNIYHEQQLKYRGLAAPVEEMEEGEEEGGAGETTTSRLLGGSLEELWGFECSLCAGRNVSCMAWNTLQPDLLAVAYGEFEFTKQTDGLILFWSLKNPGYPMKTYRTPCSVTSIAFANRSPHLLGVGMYDGTVAVYDVRKEEDKPVLESGYGGGKHSDCVWEVRWTDKDHGAERGEVLVSVSSDGRVAQWSMSKGLEHTDLIKLKRVNTQSKSAAANTKREAFISRMASGMCADFNPKDPSLYIVGTEEGAMHKCSVSYNEQYLDTYTGHSGPVYKVAWSPFLSSAFLSCSADWSVKMWHSDQEAPLLSMQSSSDCVNDIQWSPTVSTVFASVTGDGDVNIWDMSVSTLDPIFKTKVAPRRPSCVRFSPNCDVLVAGDSSGRVSVYALTGVDGSHFSAEEQVARLEKALAAKDSAE